MSAHRVVVDSRYGHERATLFCAAGHEVVSSPTSNATGRRLAAGDVSRESCGYGSCPWNGESA